MKKMAIVATLGILGFAQVAAAPSAYSTNATITYEVQGPVGKFKGNNKTVTGKFTWEASNDSLKGSVCVEQKAWTSGEAIRDEHTRNMFEIEKFPTACLELSSIDGDVKAGNVTVMGKLTMHGKTSEIKIPSTVKQDGTKLIFNGKFVTKVTGWDMKRPSLLGITVGDDVTVSIAGEAVAP